MGTKNNSSSIKAHKPPVLFARRRSTLESFSKHHFMKLRQHFHALVFDRMKVFQNYFLSTARKKVNKKKKKERKKNWTLRWQGGKIITLKTLRTNDLILVLSICNYCARKNKYFFLCWSTELPSFICSSTSRHSWVLEQTRPLFVRQQFHAFVFDRMKVFQNYFLSSARKKENKTKQNKKKKKKKKETKREKKNWTLRWQGGKIIIITLKTLRKNDLILVLTICNYCVRTNNTSSSAEAQNLPVLFARRRRDTLEYWRKKPGPFL